MISEASPATLVSAPPGTATSIAGNDASILVFVLILILLPSVNEGLLIVPCIVGLLAIHSLDPNTTQGVVKLLVL